MQYCPVCNQKVDSYIETDVDTPFTHWNPMLGIDIWGPYSSEKPVVCETNEYVHFTFAGQDRLVKLGCEMPDEDWDLEDDDDECPDDDVYDEHDEEEFPHGLLDY